MSAAPTSITVNEYGTADVTTVPDSSGAWIGGIQDGTFTRMLLTESKRGRLQKRLVPDDPLQPIEIPGMKHAETDEQVYLFTSEGLDDKLLARLIGLCIKLGGEELRVHFATHFWPTALVDLENGKQALAVLTFLEIRPNGEICISHAAGGNALPMSGTNPISVPLIANVRDEGVGEIGTLPVNLVLHTMSATLKPGKKINVGGMNVNTQDDIHVFTTFPLTSKELVTTHHQPHADDTESFGSVILTLDDDGEIHQLTPLDIHGALFRQVPLMHNMGNWHQGKFKKIFRALQNPPQASGLWTEGGPGYDVYFDHREPTSPEALEAGVVKGFQSLGVIPPDAVEDMSASGW